MAQAVKSAGKGVAGRAGRTLLREAQNYAEARGEQMIRNLGQKAIGALTGDGTGGDGGGSGVGGLATQAVTSGVKGVAQRALGGGGKRRGRGGGKPTNIIEDIDVGVPISTAYNQWTEFDHFADFMKGVEGVDKDEKDLTKSNWRLKVGPSRRSWQATTEEQVPDRRIKWSSQGAKGSTKGVVTFHPLADDLTKIIVVIEYTAVGPFEKVGNMMRLQLRRVRLDLREFKKFITTQNEATGEWRGEIRDGEVVSERDEGQEGEEEGGQEEQPDPEAEEQDRDEESESDSEEEAEPEEPEEEPERPAARQPAGAGGGRRGGRR